MTDLASALAAPFERIAMPDPTPSATSSGS